VQLWQTEQAQGRTPRRSCRLSTRRPGRPHRGGARAVSALRRASRREHPQPMKSARTIEGTTDPCPRGSRDQGPESVRADFRHEGGAPLSLRSFGTYPRHIESRPALPSTRPKGRALAPICGRRTLSRVPRGPRVAHVHRATVLVVVIPTGRNTPKKAPTSAVRMYLESQRHQQSRRYPPGARALGDFAFPASRDAKGPPPECGFPRGALQVRHSTSR
jgi:hypothetical protein